jgi:hypothetical protein
MGYCEDDVDAWGTPASVACPVACDSCQLGRFLSPQFTFNMTGYKQNRPEVVHSFFVNNTVSEMKS